MVFQTSTITVQSDESAQSGLPMLGDLQGQVLEPLRTGVREGYEVRRLRGQVLGRGLG